MIKSHPSRIKTGSVKKKKQKKKKQKKKQQQKEEDKDIASERSKALLSLSLSLSPSLEPLTETHIVVVDDFLHCRREHSLVRGKLVVVNEEELQPI